MASAARKDFERLDCLDRASNRCFVKESIRMERVSVIVCARLYTSSHIDAPAESLQGFLALTERIAVQAGDDFAGERHGDDFSASRIGMNEIGGHEARLGCVPARHRALAAHGLKRVKEAAACLPRDTALECDDARNGGHGLDHLAGELLQIEVLFVGG